MVNSLLSPSSVYLFGQKVSDLSVVPTVAPNLVIDVRLAANSNKTITNKISKIDGVNVEEGDIVLLGNQENPGERGIYTINNIGVPENYKFNTDEYYRVLEGRKNKNKYFHSERARRVFIEEEPNLGLSNRGGNRFLEAQLNKADDPCFARVFGFSYNGFYQELARPTNFLVHGDGDAVSDEGFNLSPVKSPLDPSLTGIGAADFNLASRMRVWVYDRSDFTIRMDLDGGMFEELLVNWELGGYDDVYGGLVGGGKVGGGKVGGGKVGGGKVGGGKVGGGKIGG